MTPTMRRVVRDMQAHGGVGVQDYYRFDMLKREYVATSSTFWQALDVKAKVPRVQTLDALRKLGLVAYSDGYYLTKKGLKA